MSDTVCTDCGYILFNADNMPLHKEKYCSAKPPKVFNCEACGRVCKSERGLNTHLESYCSKRITVNGNDGDKNVRGKAIQKASKTQPMLSVIAEELSNADTVDANFAFINILLCPKCKTSYDGKDFRRMQNGMYHAPVYFCNECFIANKKLEEVVFPNS